VRPLSKAQEAPMVGYVTVGTNDFPRAAKCDELGVFFNR
jgi:hypothetical protein